MYSAGMRATRGGGVCARGPCGPCIAPSARGRVTHPPHGKHTSTASPHAHPALVTPAQTRSPPRTTCPPVAIKCRAGDVSRPIRQTTPQPRTLYMASPHQPPPNSRFPSAFNRPLRPFCIIPSRCCFAITLVTIAPRFPPRNYIHFIPSSNRQPVNNHAVGRDGAELRITSRPPTGIHFQTALSSGVRLAVTLHIACEWRTLYSQSNTPSLRFAWPNSAMPCLLCYLSRENHIYCLPSADVCRIKLQNHSQHVYHITQSFFSHTSWSNPLTYVVTNCPLARSNRINTYHTSLATSPTVFTRHQLT